MAGIPDHEIADVNSKMRTYERFRTSILGLRAEFTISIMTFRIFLAYIVHSGHAGVAVYASKIRKACLDRGLFVDADAFKMTFLKMPATLFRSGENSFERMTG